MENKALILLRERNQLREEAKILYAQSNITEARLKSNAARKLDKMAIEQLERDIERDVSKTTSSKDKDVDITESIWVDYLLNI